MEVPQKIRKELLKVEKPVYLTYEDYPIEDLLVYGGIDCLVTSGILERLMPIITEEPSYVVVERDTTGRMVRRNSTIMSIAESYAGYTTEAHEFIMDLEMNGIKYDVDLNLVVKTQLEREIAELESIIFKEIGFKLNLNSGQEVGKYLYEERNFPVNRRTKTGEPSTDGEAIKELADAYPEEMWLAPLAKRNDLASIYRTFVVTYVEDFVKRDGRVHGEYSMHGTGSFRIAVDSPNLTQLPRPKHGYNLRRFFTVPPGNVFMAFDFSSAEVKILGALCKDPELLRAIKEGMDFHSLSASKMYNIVYEEFVAVVDDKKNPLHKDYKEKRQYSKALTLN